MLQNSIDLIVKAADGTDQHGNVGTANDFDKVNNVEQALWKNMPPGAPRLLSVNPFSQAPAILCLCLADQLRQLVVAVGM